MVIDLMTKLMRRTKNYFPHLEKKKGKKYILKPSGCPNVRVMFLSDQKGDRAFLYSVISNDTPLKHSLGKEEKKQQLNSKKE